MEAAVAADQNNTRSATMVAEFVISCVQKLLALLLCLEIHLIKLCAVITNGLCAHLLSLLNQILPPRSKFDSIHHYMNELEGLATAKLNRFVAQVYETYPLVKRFILVKLEDTIRYMEARKQEFASNKSEEHLIVRSVLVSLATVAIGFVFVRMCGCGRRSKMMKAPGRGGAEMRREDFEKDPKKYFTSLHSRSQRGMLGGRGVRIREIPKWLPPVAPWVKLNVDGSHRPATRGIGAGGVIRNEVGVLQGGFAAKTVGDSAFFAELYGVFQGLKLCQDKGFTMVTVECDAKAVVEALTCDVPEVNKWFGLLCKCRELIDNDSMQIEVKHISREQNYAADWVAKASHNLQEDLVFFDSPDEELKVILDKDVSQIVAH